MHRSSFSENRASRIVDLKYDGNAEVSFGVVGLVAEPAYLELSEEFDDIELRRSCLVAG